MFAYISGKLVHKEPALVILECNGIGYEIRISMPTYSALEVEKVCRLHTYLHIKEDAHTLYGFVDHEEKKLFLHLISVSGIGPNTALMIISSLSALEIREAIVRENVRLLQGIKGIGTKTAQRLILELKDKIKKEDISDSALPSGKVVSTLFSANQVRHEALTALVTLGIPKPSAEKSIDAVIKKHGNDLSLEDMVKYALKSN